MTVFSYRTIAQKSEGFYKEKGSKFISFAFPVENEQQIKDALQQLREQYFDARHHCYAWMLGPERKHFRAFDDGEPNHSAGDPILGQIRSKEITNVLIVVVRYFGGTKLGVSGLIAAYKIASADALDKATIIEKEITEVLPVSFDYTSTPEVMKLIKDFNLQIIDQHFENETNMKLQYRLKDKPSLLEKIKLLQATGTKIRTPEEF